MIRLKKGVRYAIVIILLFTNIGCDQISKNIARNNIEYGEKISVVADYLTLTKVENTGAFLSLGHNMPELIRIILLMIMPAMALLGMFLYVFFNKKMDLNNLLAITFIIGGGLGNIYDRIVHGSVTDFLHMDFQLFQTGIFNMADVSIMIGTFWLLFTHFKQGYLDRKTVVG